MTKLPVIVILENKHMIIVDINAIRQIFLRIVPVEFLLSRVADNYAAIYILSIFQDIIQNSLFCQESICIKVPVIDYGFINNYCVFIYCFDNMYGEGFFALAWSPDFCRTKQLPEKKINPATAYERRNKAALMFMIIVFNNWASDIIMSKTDSNLLINSHQ